MKPLLYTLILFLFLFTSKASYSQESELYQLELKSGITVMCYLVSITDNIIYGITEDGKKFNVNMQDVKSFVKVDPFKMPVKQESVSPPPPIEPMILKRNTVTGTFMMGPLIYTRQSLAAYFSATGILNYEMGHISAGAGISIDAIPYNTFIPIFADIKYNFEPTQGGTPFVFADIGYTFTSYSGNGLMLSGGVGIKKKVSRDIDLMAQIGFKHQIYSYSYSYALYGGGDYEYNYRETLNFIAMNVGIRF